MLQLVSTFPNPCAPLIFSPQVYLIKSYMSIINHSNKYFLIITSICLRISTNLYSTYLWIMMLLFSTYPFAYFKHAAECFQTAKLPIYKY